MHYMIREHAHPTGTIVLVHGLGTSSSSWVRVLQHFNRSHRVVVPDLPGFGFSRVNVARGFCLLSEHVEALSELMTEVGDTPIILVGQSLGGWICCRYAARVPSRIEHLVLIDTAGIYYPGVETLRDLFTLTSVRDTRRLLNALWYRYPWYFKPFAGSIFHELESRRMNEIVASIEASDFLNEEYARLTMPVSIIWGRQDSVLPMKSVDVLKRSIPHSTVHLIDQCGHVPQLECPEKLARILNGVLDV